MKLMPGFEILSYDNVAEREKWRSICNSFENIDIYYLPEYGRLFELHGDGKPYLFVYYESGDRFVIYPFLKRSLSETLGFKKFDVNLFDITSPYGYGGYLRNSESINMEQFSGCFHEYCVENNIISEFIRFHPIIENVKYVPKNVDIKQYNQTVVIELHQPAEDIWKNMNQTCRNKIRKAIKNNIRIEFDKDCRELDIFIDYYTNTMKRLGADDFYYFDPNWFREMIKLVNNQILLCHAYFKDKIIASAMFLVHYPYIHYFLTGTLYEARQLAAMNLLLHEVAMWAKDKGLKYFHLGGGCFPNDSLFGFKASFSNSRRDFYIGGVVHHQDYYDCLCKLRFEDEMIKKDMIFFPLYRMPKKYKICENHLCSIL